MKYRPASNLIVLRHLGQQYDPHDRIGTAQNFRARVHKNKCRSAVASSFGAGKSPDYGGVPSARLLVRPPNLKTYLWGTSG